MKNTYKVLTVSLLFLILIGIAVIAYKLSFASLGDGRSNSLQHVDYTNVVVILLTTVTVLFTLFAIIIALMSFMGVMNLQSTAEEIAARETQRYVDEELNDDGKIYDLIDSKMRTHGDLLQSIKAEIIQDIRSDFQETLFNQTAADDNEEDEQT